MVSHLVLDWLSMLNTHVWWFCYTIPPRLSCIDHPFVIHRSSTLQWLYLINHPFPISFMMNELELTSLWRHFFMMVHSGESSIIILIHGRDGFLQLLSGSFRWVNYSSSARNSSFITNLSWWCFMNIISYIEIWSDWFQERFKPESPIVHHISCENPDVSWFSWENHGKSHGFRIPFSQLGPLSFPVRVIGRQEVDVRWEQTGRQITETCYERRGSDFSRWISRWFFMVLPSGKLT